MTDRYALLAIAISEADAFPDQDRMLKTQKFDSVISLALEHFPELPSVREMAGILAAEYTLPSYDAEGLKSVPPEVLGAMLPFNIVAVNPIPSLREAFYGIGKFPGWQAYFARYEAIGKQAMEEYKGRAPAHVG